MRTAKLLMVSAAFILGTVAAKAAGDETQSPAPADPHRIVCEHQVFEGTIVRRPSSCRTAQSIAAEKEQNRQQIRMFQIRSSYIKPH